MHLASAGRHRCPTQRQSCEAMLLATNILSFAGGAFRPWFLAIVRNTAMTWFKRTRSAKVLFVPYFQSEEAGSRRKTPPRRKARRAPSAAANLYSSRNRAVGRAPDDSASGSCGGTAGPVPTRRIAAVSDARIGTVHVGLSARAGFHGMPCRSIRIILPLSSPCRSLELMSMSRFRAAEKRAVDKHAGRLFRCHTQIERH